MAITNQLAVSFNHQKIDASFDFFQLTTAEKFIAKGAYLLDKPVLALKARSVVFDYGKTAFVMFNAGQITRTDFVEAIGDETISIKKISCANLKDYILLRLFLYSLANYQSEENQFNNLTGKLYLNRPAWFKPKSKSVMALAIDVDQDMCLSIEANTFTSVSRFPNDKRVKFEYPKYVIEKNGKMRRVLFAESGQDVFVKKGIPGHKAEYPFFTLWREKMRETKAWFFFKTLRDLSARYSEFLEIRPCEVAISKNVVTKRDAQFVKTAIDILSEKKLAVIDWTHESAYEEDFLDLKKSLEKALGRPIPIANAPSMDSCSVILLHDKETYEKEGEDPYSKIDRNAVVQCATVEDSLNQILEEKAAVINTIIKELAIKADLKDGAIRMDDWSSFGFTGDWLFGAQVDKSMYFLRVHPNGGMAFYEPAVLFGNTGDPEVDRLIKIADGSRARGKTIIADDKGNIILISRTSRYCLPNPEVFDLEQTSHSKEAREKYLSGIVDINLYHVGNRCFYSAGIIGATMQPRIPKASLFYEVETLAGSNIIENLLATMSVMFVKYNSFTVLPYPVKYLREFIAAKK